MVELMQQSSGSGSRASNQKTSLKSGVQGIQAHPIDNAKYEFFNTWGDDREGDSPQGEDPDHLICWTTFLTVKISYQMVRF